MSKGWISVHRQIWNSWVWDEKPFSKGQAWIDLLLMANHEDKKVLIRNQLVIVKRGSFITSQIKLMERWGWGKEKLRNFLRLLESDEMIEVDTTPRYTLIAITNYETYQTQYHNQTIENPVIPVNREEYQTKVRPKSDQKQTANRPNTDRTPTTNNNDNNINNNAYIAASEIDEVINFYTEHFNDHNPSNLSQIESYMDDMQPTLVKKAMEIAIERDKRFFRYVRGILESWLSKGIKTIEEYEREELYKPQQQEENFGGPYVPNAEETRKMMDELLRGMKYENTAP